MIYKHKFISLILLFILLLTFQVQSQSFLITKYSTDTGLPDNRVNDIAQDSLGRIWIAMASGIAMYDGYEWTKFGEKDGVPEVDYVKINIDSRGKIWFLPKQLYNQSLMIFNKNKWEKFNLKSDVNNTRSYTNSFIIVYTDDRLNIYISKINKGLIHYDGKNWEVIKTKQGLICDSISNINYLNDKVLISTYKGVSVFKGNKVLYNIILEGALNKFPVIGVTKFSSYLGEPERIFAFGSDWIGEIKDKRIVPIKSGIRLPSLGFNDPHFICSDNVNSIYFGNSSLLYHYYIKINTLKKIDLESPESDRGGSSILVDYEKNLWVTSLRGIYKLTHSPFENFVKSRGLPEVEVSAISQFNSGEIVFGHNYGVTVVDEQKFNYYKIASPENVKSVISRITSIYHDQKKDLIYLTSVQSGILSLNQRGIVRRTVIPGATRYNNVYSYPDGGIIIFSDKGIHGIGNNYKYDVPVFPMIRKVILDKKKDYLIGSSAGLYLWNPIANKIVLAKNPNLLNIFSLLQSNNEEIFVGSLTGLYKLEADSLIKFNFNEQDITDPIYFIIQDSLKNIWLGTNNGVLKWDGKNLKRYNKSDGLAGNETNRAAGFVDSKGNVWIGTDEGVSMYTGNEPDYSKYPPKVLLLNFKDHSNQNYNINSAAKVDPDKNNLTFSYRGLSYIDEKRNLYEIRLVEVDGDYQNEFTTKSTSTRFNNLAAGDYIFSVRVQNAKGIWSPWKNSAIITIKEHFYNQTLFYLSVLGFFLVAAYTINNYFQQKRYTKKLEFAVNERTKDLKEIQTQLVTSLDRYKGIVESQTDLVIRFTPDGILTYVNDAYCAVFGKIPKEIIGKSFVPLIHPEDVEATFEVIKKLNDPPYRSTLEQRDFTISGYRWFSWEGYAFRNQFEDIVEIQAVGRDITLQKEVEAELEKRVYERTIELQSLISQSPLGILTFDENGNLISYNKIASEMFCSLDDYISKKGMNLFEDELLLKNNYKEKLLNLDTPNSFLLTVPIKIDKIENKIYQKLQDHFLVYRIYNVMFDEKNKMYVLLVDDVTEQQQTDEISKKLVEEKIRISAIIKTIETERERFSKELHDGLGQLLTTAKLKLDIIKIKSDESVKEVNDTLNILINAGDEIRRIISDLKPADVESFGLVSSIELLVERIKQASNVNILLAVLTNIQIEKKEHEIVVYRIIQEALNNIVKHSKCNRAIIELSIFNNELLLKISDDGVGIDLKKQNQKFKSYGVQNIKERVSSLNGKVEIESEPGKGFKYSINIPL